MKKYSSRQVAKFVKKMQQQNILVIGDVMLDQFIWGKVDRISPEAPVPVVHVTHESAYPGGAANVARNLTQFGIKSTMCGIIGQDMNGKKLLGILKESGIATDGLLALPEYQTIVKTRIIARHQQVVRVDRESPDPLKMEQLANLVNKLETMVQSATAIIIEDYGKGLINQEFADIVIALAQKHKKIVTVDPNPKNPLIWNGVTLVKPNRMEAFAAANIPVSEDRDTLLKVGEKLLEIWKTALLLITLGEDGLIMFQQGYPPFHTPTKAVEVFDVSGAGDTVIAFFTAALAAGLNSYEAAQLSNHAAGIVVGKLGTATLTPEELLKSFDDVE